MTQSNNLTSLNIYMKWYNSSCQLISYFNSYNLTGCHVGPEPAWLLQHCAGWTTCQLDPASSVDSKRYSTANFWYPLFWTYNGRAHYTTARLIFGIHCSEHIMDVLTRQSSLVSLSRAHLLQSRCTHLASSEWQCSSVPVVLLHPSRWRAILIETPIIHLRPTDCSILQPLYCRHASLSSLRRQSLQQSPCTSHISTVAHGFLSASYDFSLLVLLPWLN